MTPDGNLTPALNPDATADAVLVDQAAEPAPSAKNQAGRAVREVVETLLLAALIFFLVRLVVLNFRVDGESMLPNLGDGQMLLVNRNAYQYVDVGGNRYYPFDPPERGDVIVFKTPPQAQQRCGAGGTFVKRLIGLPGERVELRAEGGLTYVFIDGKRLDESSYLDRDRRGSGETQTYNVSDGHYFMMGDNRAKSCDSREWGSVPRDNLIGKVFATYWPPNRISFR